MFLRRLRRRIPKAVTFESHSDAADLRSKLGDEDGSNNSDDDNEPPAIERVASCESASTASSAVLSPRLPFLKGEASELVQKIIAEEQILEILEECSDGDASPVSTDSRYFSKDDLETLLTSEFLDDFNVLMERDAAQKQEEIQNRKELIQRELDALLEATMADLENDGQDLEVEAVEALGIAANRVAYLDKYYDVASCKYIYVPSVAHTVLNGSLLEEACNHYFGAKEEFLVAYAGSLGTTVIRNQHPNDHGLAGKKDIHVDIPAVAELSPGMESWTYEAASNWCWGVSPSAVAENDCQCQTPVKDTETSDKRTPFNKKRVLTVVIGLPVFLAALIWFAINITPRPLDEMMAENESKLSTLVEQPSNFVFSSTYEGAITVIPSENPMVTHSNSSAMAKGTYSNDNTSGRLAKQLQGAPIVPNLLYY